MQKKKGLTMSTRMCISLRALKEINTKKKKEIKLYDDDFYKAGEKKKTLESIINIKNINEICSVASKLIWGFFFFSF